MGKADQLGVLYLQNGHYSDGLMDLGYVNAGRYTH